jgi:hypothetical protein
MRKTTITAILALGLLVTPAAATQCPLLIKQVTDAMATMNAQDAKVKTARELIEQARKLHVEGQHADSIAKVDEAAKLLGVTLKKS